MKRQQNLRSAIARSRAGATTVEMAFVLPLLMTLILGGIEFTRFSEIRHVVDNAAYEAARHVMVPGGNEEEAKQLALDILKRHNIAEGKIDISPSPLTEEAKYVSVRVTAAAAPNSWRSMGFTRGMTVSSSTTLLTERSPTVQAVAVKEDPSVPWEDASAAAASSSSGSGSGSSPASDPADLGGL